MGENRNAYKVFLEKPEEMRALETSHKREDNIKMDLEEMGFEYVDWIHGTHDRVQILFLLNKVMKLAQLNKDAFDLYSDLNIVSL
jgi:uncharacterized protein with GYD domain